MASLYLYNDSILIAGSVLIAVRACPLDFARTPQQPARQAHCDRLVTQHCPTLSGALREAPAGVMFGSTVRSAHDSQLTSDRFCCWLTVFRAPSATAAAPRARASTSIFGLQKVIVESTKIPLIDPPNRSLFQRPAWVVRHKFVPFSKSAQIEYL